jgi:hypothetical protein
MVSRKKVGVGKRRRGDQYIQDKLCFEVESVCGPEKDCKAARWVWLMKGNGRELWGCLRLIDMGR